MKNQNLVIKLCGLLAVSLLPGVASISAADPYPLEYFALRAAVSGVQVSPDGEKLAMLKILTREGNPVLHIYDSDNLDDAEPFAVNSDPMEIMTFYWAGDNHIAMTLRQKVRDKIEGQNQGVYEYRVAILDVINEEFEDFDAARPVIENVVPGKPDKIIISEMPGVEDFGIREAFRPRAYYEMDLKRNTKKLLIRGKLDLGQIKFDGDGDPVLARGYDAGEQEYVLYHRAKGEKGWNDVMRWGEDDFELWTEPLDAWPDPAVRGNIVVITHNGDDKSGLWSLNPKTGQFDELLYRRSDVDVYDFRLHSNSWSYPDVVTAVGYYKDNFHFEYFDEVEGATFAQLESLIPNAHYVRINSRSRDGNTLTAWNVGPKDPGSYYLYRNGEFKLVGNAYPLLDPEQLADVEYITYEARDGRKIPGFVTMPNGEPPFPLVVLPHGGPHVTEVVLYDEWAQMLANNGYMVLQPQYRMSMNYGFEHFTSAFLKEGSQAGRKMQDDKDDGALHLIEEGLADPDRVAMFGWSYGGYAALVAASRTPQIYQCVIAGAAVSDYRRQANEYNNASSGTGKIWNEQYQYGAVEPVEEAPKVNVPVLLIHGDVDQRVRPRQAKLYLKELKKHNKPHKMLWLEGADHFSNTLFYNHQIKLYEEMIAFLENDCGMKQELTASTRDD